MVQGQTAAAILPEHGAGRKCTLHTVSHLGKRGKKKTRFISHALKMV